MSKPLLYAAVVFIIAGFSNGILDGFGNDIYSTAKGLAISNGQLTEIGFTITISLILVGVGLLIFTILKSRKQKGGTSSGGNKPSSGDGQMFDLTKSNKNIFRTRIEGDGQPRIAKLNKSDENVFDSTVVKPLPPEEDRRDDDSQNKAAG